jgi:molecular chaperone HscB
MKNYFELFSLEADFSIDLVALEQIYQTQIARHHPDKFATGSDKEKTLAVQNTSLINSAFDTLKSPLLRATYLLELQGIDAFDEKTCPTQALTFLLYQIFVS